MPCFVINRTARAALCVAALAAGSLAGAAETVKIAFIEVLSGPFAQTGMGALAHVRDVVSQLNASAGPQDPKFEVVPFDGKGTPQESTNVLRAAYDQNIHYVTQGGGSGVAFALVDAINKQTRRDPNSAMVYLNYSAMDPGLTNDKCNFWHFRFDADADMKMAAMTNVIAKDRNVHKVYLINQDYSFGRAVAAAARRMLAEKRPDIAIVGDEFHPLQKVQDFSPYVAKIKASGADTVITGNWSNDMVLLVRAGKDAGLKVEWETFYGGSPGAVTAIGEAGVGSLKQVSEWHKNATPELDATVAAFDKRYPGKENEYTYWRAKTMWELFAAAAKKAQSNDPIKVANALEGLKMQTPLGEVEMRADNHQLLQPLYVSTLSRGMKYDVESSGLGWKSDAKIDAAATALPTTCKAEHPK